MTPTKPTTGAEITEADRISGAKILVLRLGDDIPENVLEGGYDECRAWAVTNYPLIHEEYSRIFAAHRSEACRAAVAQKQEFIDNLVDCLKSIGVTEPDGQLCWCSHDPVYSNSQVHGPKCAAIRTELRLIRQHAQPPASGAGE